MRYVHLLIKRSETDTIRLEVPAWEVPVLQAVHGEGLTETGDFETVNRPHPEPVGEYERLTQRYGRDNESGQTYVSMVYGLNSGQLGVAIRAAIAEEAAANVVVPPKPLTKAQKQAAAKAAAEAQPLDAEGEGEGDPTQ